MIVVVLEAAVRSAVLITLVWAAIALFRLRNPHRLKALWASVVVASLGMPLLMQLHIAPAVPAPTVQWTIRPSEGSLAHASSMQAFGILVCVVPSLLLLLRYALAWKRLWRIRRESRVLCDPLADALDVRVSARISSPSTFGTTILLPQECSTWSRPKLAAVMAHERAHVILRDCYVLWLARFHACVFWFNPLAWWLVQQLSALAEQTSDEAAVQTVGNRADYAEILLGLRASRANEVAAAMASSDLPARIERILSGVTTSQALRRTQLVLVVLAVLPAVALAAAPLQLAAASSANGTSASAATAANRLEPHVVSSPPLLRYYPRQAMREGIDGMVLLAITLDRAGRATDTRILTENPLDMGFGAAASTVAHVMKYSNPTGRQVTFDVRLVFKLSHAPADHADAPPAAASH